MRELSWVEGGSRKAGGWASKEKNECIENES
jgi:hypothetical protein